MTIKCKRKLPLAGLLLAFCPVLAPGLPQVAVLDVILAAGIDPTVAVPITDRIIEELVTSARFSVLDRSNIERILKEKEFQLSSGIVGDAEMRQAGEYLGADMVVVASLSRVGATYVISARIIDVVTGQISLQVSSEQKGSIDVVLDVARAVGQQLASSARAAPVEVQEERVATQAAETPTAVGEDSSSATASLRTLIKAGGHLRAPERNTMTALVRDLSEETRLSLYASSYRHDGVKGLLLNLLLPSLGSWIQGDATGALWSLVLIGGGAGLSFALGAVTFDSFGALGGFAVIAGGLVYEIVRPLSYVTAWNRALAELLDVPYVTVMGSRNDAVAVAPGGPVTPTGVTVQILSIRY